MARQLFVHEYPTMVIMNDNYHPDHFDMETTSF